MKTVFPYKKQSVETSRSTCVLACSLYSLNFLRQEAFPYLNAIKICGGHDLLIL